MSELEYVLSLLQPDISQIEAGRTRQAAVWRGEEPDYAPILLPGVQVPEKAGWPDYNYKEQFYDPEKMLIAHLWGLISQARSAGDGQLSMRPNLGTGFIPTVFGLEQGVFEDKMPWLKEHLPKEKILSLSPDDFNEENVKGSGLVPRALEYIAFFKEKLNGKAHVHLSDTQGSWDIAHLVYGDGIFTEIYDDPDFVHHLLRLATAAYISVTKVLKRAVGEDLSSGYLFNLYMGDGGVRCSEDTATLLSRKVFNEFVAPYIASVLRPFGGGWVHFCGSGHQFLEDLVKIPEVKAINFGNPERYEYETVMGLVLDNGKFYIGGFPRLAGESLRRYFERILRPLADRGTRRGIIFTPAKADFLDDEEPAMAFDLWHVIQDEII
ncbi:MAG: hypothetical protein HPY52_07380 [Firmicutes bacterium]|nr:hypothetical protein [Bacillota bacterium]